jgi:hypothetical protein
VSAQVFDDIAEQLLRFTVQIGADLDRELLDEERNHDRFRKAVVDWSKLVLALHAERRQQHAAARWMTVERPATTSLYDDVERTRQRLLDESK